MNDFLTRLAVTVNTGSDPDSTTTVNIPTGSADSLLANGLNLVYFLAGVAAIVVIIIAGIMYTISSGDAGRMTKAKNLLTYAIVGLVVVLVAFTVTNFFIGRFS